MLVFRLPNLLTARPVVYVTLLSQALMLSNDLRHATILTLAIGIGANTLIFSVLNTEVVRPPPFANPHRLVQVAEKNDNKLASWAASSVPNYRSWREQSQTIGEMGAILDLGSFAITDAATP